jgi:hypothetical protein
MSIALRTTRDQRVWHVDNVAVLDLPVTNAMTCH